jgi:phage-related protein
MALFDFNNDISPEIVPGFQSRKAIDHNIKANGFGDGYVQRSANGLNSRKDKWSLVFDAVNNTRADTLETFVNDQGCVTPFLWTPPLEATQKQWIVLPNTFNREFLGPDTSTISFNIEQDFSIQ